LIAGSDEWTKVRETVVRQNQTPIDEEAIVYRVVKIQWVNLFTSIDTMTNGSGTTGSNVRKQLSIFFMRCFIYITTGSFIRCIFNKRTWK